MIKWARIILISIVFWITLCNYSYAVPKPWNSEGKTIIASIPEENIYLYAKENMERHRRYEDFTLVWGNQKKYFDWINEHLFKPELFLSDIDNDGKKELIIVLTQGHGTGILDTEPHVIEPETLKDVHIESPISIYLKNVRTAITPKGAEIIIKNKKSVVKLKSEKKNWFKDVGYGAMITWKVEDNHLVAGVSLQVSPSEFIGSVKITYIFKDKMYQVDKIEY
jgi:hypothetical protein